MKTLRETQPEDRVSSFSTGFSWSSLNCTSSAEDVILCTDICRLRAVREHKLLVIVFILLYSLLAVKAISVEDPRIFVKSNSND